MAALLVVLYHATVLFGAGKYWGVTVLGGVFGFGFAGVEFFFVLSGFLMIHVHRRDFGKPFRLPRYAGKRVLRIYPIYWIVTLAFSGLYISVQDPRAGYLPNSIALIGLKNDAVLAVAWTLFHEIVFYLFFALLILSKRAGAALMGAWFCSCLLWFDATPPHYALASINLLFGIGMAAAMLAAHIPFPRLMTLLGGLAFVGIGMEGVYLKLLTEDQREIVFGLAAASGIAGAVKAEAAGTLTVPHWLSRLGDASYSLYLLHYPLLAIFAKVWLASPLRTIPAGIAFVVLALACIAAGIAFYLVIERPIIRAARRLLAGRGPERAADRTGATTTNPR